VRLSGRGTWLHQGRLRAVCGRGPQITTLQWTVGALCAVLGVLLVIVPHQFVNPQSAALQPHLVPVGFALLLSGAGLLATAILAPRRRIVCGAHLLAGGVLLVVMSTFVSSGRWAGVVDSAILGVGTILAPFVSRPRRRGQHATDVDLCIVLVGVSTTLLGLLFLVVPELFGSPVYDLARPSLPALGVLGVSGGLVLLADQVRPQRSRWRMLLVRVPAAASLFALLALVAWPQHLWTSVVYDGGFGTVVLALPWLAARHHGPAPLHRQRVRGRRPRSLQTQLAIILTVAVAAPLLVVAPLYGQEEAAQRLEEARVRQQTLATALAQDVADNVQLHVAAVKQLAVRPDLLDLALADQHAVLRAAATAYPDIVGFGTVSAAGEPMARSDDKQGTSWVGDPTFEAARTTRQPTVQVRVSPVVHRPIFSIGVPVLDPEGRFLGMVGSSLDAARITDLLTQTDTIAAARVYLVDGRGRAIAHPEVDLVATFTDLSATPAVAAFLADPAPNGSFGSARPDSTVVVGYARVPGLDWGVIVERPVDVVLAPTREQLDLLLLVVLAGVTAAVAIGHVVAGRMTRPLATLAAAVERLAAGDDGAALPDETASELDAVTSAFAAMRAELVARTAELQRLSLVAQHTQEAVVLTDRAGVIEWVNGPYAAMSGHPSEALIGRRPAEVLAGPDTDPETAARIQAAVEAGHGFHEELVHVRRDGTPYWVSLDVSPILGRSGRCLGFVGIQHDITERRRAEEERGRLAAIVASSEDAIISKTLDGTISSWNRGAEQLYGYTAQEAIGQPITLIVPAARQVEIGSILTRLADGERVLLHETQRVHKDGRELDVSVSISPIRDRRDAVIGAAAITRDISERKRAERALAHQAHHDALTDLPNRSLFQERLDTTLATLRTDGTPLALLLLDLDRFKEVNDTLGHDVGDVVLQQVADRLRGGLRAGDTIARLGGDEFAVLLPGADDATALAVATRLRAALVQPIEVNGLRLEVGTSIGMALGPAHGRDAATLLRRADMAMYAAKRAGQGVRRFSPELDREDAERLSLTAELRQAIEQGQLVLHYQPKVELASGQAVGVEALVRWQHPARGLLGPDRFIPVAEQAGLIEPLTRWVLRTACVQQAAWRAQGLDLAVAVNLSMSSLADPGLLETVREALAMHDNRGPGRLELELTESTLMADPERARVLLADLRALGVRIAVDDFGTGYSSLAYLKQLPLDELKIDRCFVRDMASDDRDRAVVQATVDLAHTLGLRVVAEGVEDALALEVLQHLGCDLAQGYHLSRPLPVDELGHWATTAAAERLAA